MLTPETHDYSVKPAILVTGGAGYIGSHACKALAEAGFLPVAYDDLSHGHQDAVRWGPLIQGDIGDAPLLQATMRTYQTIAVLHFAAFIDVGESMRAPERYFQNNVLKTMTLLEAMRAVNLGLIVFSSTCATYGLPQRLPLTEDHPQAPVSAYGESKLMVERLLHWYGQAHGFRAAILRYFNAAGADPATEIGENHQPETHLIPLILRAALGKHPAIEIYGTDYPTPDGTCIRDYIHVADLASAHVQALMRLIGGAPSDAFNLGTGTGHSVREVILAAERVTGQRVPRAIRPRRAGDPPLLVADPDKARRILGWRPGLSEIDVIVKSAWDWTRSLESRSAAILAAE